MMPLNTDMVALTNDVFKTPIPSHMYRAYTILPTTSKPTNAVEVRSLPHLRGHDVVDTTS